MDRPYLIYVNNTLWERKLTKLGALSVIKALKDKGLNATLAYGPENLKENLL